MNIAPTSIPFHIARAYGVEQAINQSRLREAAPIEPAQPTQKPAPGAERLRATLVPGRIDFSASEPAQRGESLAMYRHPSNRNAVATSIQAGRVVDTSA